MVVSVAENAGTRFRQARLSEASKQAVDEVSKSGLDDAKAAGDPSSGISLGDVLAGDRIVYATAFADEADQPRGWSE